jgi:putative salt-induced outer membrane protein YdiY
MRFIFILLFILFSLPANQCLADIIYLQNGDRLTGTIIRMEDAKLTFWSKYTGEITLFWQDVDHFTMDDTSKLIRKPTKPTEDEMDLATKEEQTTDPEIVTAVEEENTKPLTEAENTPENETKSGTETNLADTEITPNQVLAINPAPIIPVKITAKANSNLSGERGNTDKDLYYFNGEFIARTDIHRYFISGMYEREEKNNILTEDNWLTNARISHFLDNERYLYVNSLYENDKFKDLKLRSTYGAGAGYQFSESQQMNVSFSMGLAYVTEEFYVEDSKEFPSGQWAIDFDRYILRETIQLFHSDTGYVSLQNASDWFIKSKTGCKFPLIKGFTATLQYEYDWDNEPSSDADTQEDTKLLLLIGYEFNN